MNDTMQRVGVFEMVPVARLKPHPRNEEFFDDLQGRVWTELVEDIRTAGIIQPLIVTQTYTIVAGHQRYRAALELGIKEVKVQRIEFENEDAVLERMIKDNCINRFGFANTANPVKMGRCMKELKRLCNVQDVGYVREGTMSRSDFYAEMSEAMQCAPGRLYQVEQVTSLIPELQDKVADGSLSLTNAIRSFYSLSEEEQKTFIMMHGKDFRMTRKELGEAIPIVKQYQKELEAQQEQAERDQKRIAELENKLSHIRPNGTMTETEYDHLVAQGEINAEKARKYYEQIQQMKRNETQTRKINKQIGKQAGIMDHCYDTITKSFKELLKLDVDESLSDTMRGRAIAVLDLAQQLQKKFG